MITTKAQCSRREEWIVASLLNERGDWGPNLCTAIAYAPRWWENPVAGRIAEAIAKCADNPTKGNVSLKLGPEDAMWLLHPTFMNGLPLDLAEYEALELVKLYHSKRLMDIVGKAYTEAREHPEWATLIARKLRVDLTEFS